MPPATACRARTPSAWSSRSPSTGSSATSEPPASRVRAMVRREVESLPALEALLASGKPLTGARLQDLDLTGHEDELLARRDLAGLVVLGGRVTPALDAHLRAHHALVFPTDPHAPVDPYRATLYSPEELYAGLALPRVRRHAGRPRPPLGARRSPPPRRLRHPAAGHPRRLHHRRARRVRRRTTGRRGDGRARARARPDRPTRTPPTSGTGSPVSVSWSRPEVGRARWRRPTSAPWPLTGPA